MRKLYRGVAHPELEMDALRPFRAHLVRMSDQCRPFGADYLALQRLVDAIDDCATHFTKDPAFFGRA